MTAKKERVRAGKTVRAETGLPLPVAMKVGRLLYQGRGYELVHKFPSVAKYQTDCPCCGPFLVITGPKGEYRP